MFLAKRKPQSHKDLETPTARTLFQRRKKNMPQGSYFNPVRSRGSVDDISLPSSGTLEDLHKIEERRLKDLATFLGRNPRYQKHHNPDLPLKAPVQVVTVKCSSEDDHFFKVGTAWAFGRNFLFTSRHLFELEDAKIDKYQIGGIFLSNSQDPFVETNYSVEIFFKSQLFDVAILKVTNCCFRRLEMDERVPSDYKQVYHVDLIEHRRPILHSGRIAAYTKFNQPCLRRTDARNDKGFSGGPVVEWSGKVIGMHLQGSSLYSHFITTEGLVAVLLECRPNSRSDLSFWDIKALHVMDKDGPSSRPVKRPDDSTVYDIKRQRTQYQGGLSTGLEEKRVSPKSWKPTEMYNSEHRPE